jgi:hypothetical protein
MRPSQSLQQKCKDQAIDKLKPNARSLTFHATLAQPVLYPQRVSCVAAAVAHVLPE